MAVHVHVHGGAWRFCFEGLHGEDNVGAQFVALCFILKLVIS